MNKNKLTIYSIAKSVSYELLIEDLLQIKGESSVSVLEKFIKRKYSIRLKVIWLKIFNAFLFGILPIFPLIAYFEVIRLLPNAIPFEVNIFITSLIFVIFFSLQFFDFILMGIFNSIDIMSGEIFSWLKTLPISEKKLSKIALFTIFRALDLPIIVITTAFPFVMLIGTQNIILFIICFGISFLNMIFSFFLLIIFGEKFARMINLHKFKSKNTLVLQLFNTFSYTIIIFGSIFIVQISLSSIITFINIFINLEYPVTINLIFSLISFPFNPSFIISIFLNLSQINPFLWINCFLGLGLYILLIIVVSTKAITTFNKMVSGKYKTFNLHLDYKKNPVKVKTNSPVRAFLRKDLIIASRSLQTFMSIIVPIILSFVFFFYYNVTYAGGGILFSLEFSFYNWMVILGFSPILSSLIISNLSNIDISGRTIMSTLPIIPRDQALAKLILLLAVQTVSTMSPLLMYIFHPNFLLLLTIMLLALPFVYFSLILIFLMKVKLFSRIRNHFVVEEISTNRRVINWFKILILVYSIYFLVIFLVIYSVYYFQTVQALVVIHTLLTFIFFIFLYLFYKSLFPKSRKLKEIGKTKEP
jgi:hypothetical protein